MNCIEKEGSAPVVDLDGLKPEFIDEIRCHDRAYPPQAIDPIERNGCNITDMRFSPFTVHCKNNCSNRELACKLCL